MDRNSSLSICGWCLVLMLGMAVSGCSLLPYPLRLVSAESANQPSCFETDGESYCIPAAPEFRDA